MADKSTTDDGWKVVKSKGAAWKAKKELDGKRLKLTGLPEDVMHIIASHLEPGEVGHQYRGGTTGIYALRRTCKDIEMKTLRFFGSKYFSFIGVVMTADSLKALLKIAKSDKLNKFVHTLHIVTCRIQSPLEDAMFFGSGTAQRILTQTVATFSQLFTIRLVDERSVFFPARQEKCYLGYVKYTKAPRFLLFQLPDSLPSGDASMLQHLRATRFSKIFQFVTKSIAKSGINTVVNFDTGSINDGYDDASGLSLGHHHNLLDDTETAFVNCKTLTLCLLSDPTSWKTSNESYSVIDASISASLGKLASSFNGLQELNLRFANRIASGDWCHALFPYGASITSNLTKLSIKEIRISNAQLVEVLREVPNVRDLRLIDVNLSDGGWPVIFKALWKMSLDHLHLFSLSVKGRKLRFGKEPPIPAPSTTEIAAMIQQWLRESRSCPGHRFDCSHCITRPLCLIAQEDPKNAGSKQEGKSHQPVSSAFRMLTSVSVNVCLEGASKILDSLRLMILECNVY